MDPLLYIIAALTFICLVVKYFPRIKPVEVCIEPTIIEDPIAAQILKNKQAAELKTRRKISRGSSPTLTPRSPKTGRFGKAGDFDEEDDFEMSVQNEEDMFDEEAVTKYVDARKKVHEEFTGIGEVEAIDELNEELSEQIRKDTDCLFEDTSHIEPNEAEMGCVPDLHSLAEDRRKTWEPTQPTQEAREFIPPPQPAQQIQPETVGWDYNSSSRSTSHADSSVHSHSSSSSCSDDSSSGSDSSCSDD